MPELSRFRPSCVFFGTPDFAACILQAMLDDGIIPEAVVTMPDRPAGRGRQKCASAVKQLAQSMRIKTLQPASTKVEDNEELYQLLSDCNLAVVVSYGYIIPSAMLSLPHYGFINVHASLLPRWRGAAPVQRAILAGDKETGISIMQMDKGLDSGPVLDSMSCPIDKKDTSASLQNKLIKLGSQLMIASLHKLPGLTASPQDERQVSYAKKIYKQDAMINWQDSSDFIDRAIRAFNPAPIAWTLCQGQRIRLWQAQPLSVKQQETAQPGTIINYSNDGLDIATGDGIIRIHQLQLSGGTRSSLKQLIHGHKDLFKTGTTIGI